MTDYDSREARIRAAQARVEEHYRRMAANPATLSIHRREAGEYLAKRLPRLDCSVCGRAFEICPLSPAERGRRSTCSERCHRKLMAASAARLNSRRGQ